MAEKRPNVTLIDVPDPGKLEEHGVSIDAPTPTQIVMPDPWSPSSNGPAVQDSPSGSTSDGSAQPTPE